MAVYLGNARLPGVVSPDFRHKNVRLHLPFGQADSGLARRYEGTGLGLSLAKAMMELHSGRLDLDSELDRGTTVTLRFPSSRVLA